MDNIKIKLINDNSSYLDQVIKLGDKNKKTLSFTKYSVFIGCAEKKQIIIALNYQDNLLGYLMYSITYKKNKVNILHLCISSKFRGQGIARKLFEKLKNITKNKYDEIQLKCRRDYGIDRMWHNFGFIAQYEKDAKTLGKFNTFWIFKHSQAPLLELLNQQKQESKSFAIIDYQIFSELFNNPENQVLSADWLQLDLELCISNHFYNEVNKIEDQEIRNKKRNFIHKFTQISSTLDNLEILREFLNLKSIQLLEFELKHLLKTINLKKLDKYFITNNYNLLNIKDDLYHKFELIIKSPEDLVNNIDNEINYKYQPISLAGSKNIEKKLLSLDIQLNLLECFINREKKENRKNFNQKILYYLSNSDIFQCYIINNNNSIDIQLIGLIVYQRSNDYELEIPLLRINNSNLLVSTLAKHIIFESISIAYQENRNFTKITDNFLSDIVEECIKYSLFIRINNGYLKANLKIANTKINIGKKVKTITENLGNDYQFYSQIGEQLIEAKEVQDSKNFLIVEKHLFPAKIIDVNIYNFIIPIKPFWSQNLFDYKLANNTLLGVSEDRLTFNTEAIYYKSKRGGAKELKPGIKGRILWYVSGDKEYNYQDISQIRACSYLDEVVIGKAKDLYFQFSHLGIYKERDILELTRNKKIETLNLKQQLNLNQEIMAIKFSYTELFEYSINLTKIKEVLTKPLCTGSAEVY